MMGWEVKALDGIGTINDSKMFMSIVTNVKLSIIRHTLTRSNVLDFNLHFWIPLNYLPLTFQLPYFFIEASKLNGLCILFLRMTCIYMKSNSMICNQIIWWQNEVIIGKASNNNQSLIHYFLPFSYSILLEWINTYNH